MDFNTFHKTEADYLETPVLTSIIDLFFSEVEILLTTEPTSVLGNNGFGLEVTRMIWKNKLSAEKIRDEIRTSIEQNCFACQHVEDFSVDIKFQQGTERDIALVTIEAKPFDEQAQQKSFVFN